MEPLCAYGAGRRVNHPGSFLTTPELNSLVLKFYFHFSYLTPASSSLPTYGHLLIFVSFNWKQRTVTRSLVIPNSSLSTGVGQERQRELQFYVYMADSHGSSLGHWFLRLLLWLEPGNLWKVQQQVLMERDLAWPAADFPVRALGRWAMRLFLIMFQITHLSTARNFLCPLLWTSFIKHNTSQRA